MQPLQPWETWDWFLFILMFVFAFGMVIISGSGFKMEDLPPKSEAGAKVPEETKDKPPADVAQPTEPAK